MAFLHTIPEEDAEGDVAEMYDEEILDVIFTAALRCFFSKVLDATGSLADAAYRDLDVFDPDLRDTLTVGRPIADR